MVAPPEPMVTLHDGPAPTPWIELDRSTITVERVRRFLRSAAIGGVPPPLPEVAPLSFSLVLRRGHGPEIALSPHAFGIHGGHDIAMHSELVVGETYSVSGRVERIFRKTGRTGPMTLVERKVQILDAQNRLAVEIGDRQIVRWKPEAGGSRTTMRHSASHRATPRQASFPTDPHPLSTSLEIGDTVGPFARHGPKRLDISRWADSLRDRETLFHDRAGSQALGYDDLVVPGPMQSAFIDCLLGAKLPEWRTVALSMTFRQSLLAGEALEIEGTVVDTATGERTLDIVVRSSLHGETASVGTAILRQRSSAPLRS
jgi:hypothetical protein